jgi:hypothetical protein
LDRAIGPNTTTGAFFHLLEYAWNALRGALRGEPTLAPPERRRRTPPRPGLFGGAAAGGAAEDARPRRGAATTFRGRKRRLAATRAAERIPGYSTTPPAAVRVESPKRCVKCQCSRRALANYYLGSPPFLVARGRSEHLPRRAVCSGATRSKSLPSTRTTPLAGADPSSAAQVSSAAAAAAGATAAAGASAGSVFYLSSAFGDARARFTPVEILVGDAIGHLAELASLELE